MSSMTEPYASSESEYSTGSTSPSEDDADIHGRDQNMECIDSVTGIPYVRLPPDFLDYTDWSNDPDDLYLEVYFDKNGPNLANDYKVDGLRPVCKELGADRFILCDAKKRFYLWDAWDCELMRINEVWTKKFDSTEEKVENILTYLFCILEDATPIWRGRKED